MMSDEPLVRARLTFQGKPVTNWRDFEDGTLLTFDRVCEKGSIMVDGIECNWNLGKMMGGKDEFSGPQMQGVAGRPGGQCVEWDETMTVTFNPADMALT